MSSAFNKLFDTLMVFLKEFFEKVDFLNRALLGFIVPFIQSFVLFDLILYVPSTIFQLYRDGSSWVEPVLS